jgi:hypothetical protein
MWISSPRSSSCTGKSNTPSKREKSGRSWEADVPNCASSFKLHHKNRCIDKSPGIGNKDVSKKYIVAMWRTVAPEDLQG